MLFCSICGCDRFADRSILWQSLIDEWQLSPHEVDYINRQQGTSCVDCGANLRSVALANALRGVLATADVLNTIVGSSRAASLKILELNEAGTLSGALRKLPGHVFGAYPAVDMNRLPYEDESFDIVIHSDTLEHVPTPIRALSECRRVLKAGGALCYTVPTIVGRLSRSREGLAKSFHGNPDDTPDDFVVQTEFGCDMWTFPVAAGFSETRLFAVDYPAALALAAIR